MPKTDNAKIKAEIKGNTNDFFVAGICNSADLLLRLASLKRYAKDSRTLQVSEFC